MKSMRMPRFAAHASAAAFLRPCSMQAACVPRPSSPARCAIARSTAMGRWCARRLPKPRMRWRRSMACSSSWCKPKRGGRRSAARGPQPLHEWLCVVPGRAGCAAYRVQCRSRGAATAHESAGGGAGAGTIGRRARTLRPAA
jgi:hypothetical protein